MKTNYRRILSLGTTIILVITFYLVTANLVTAQQLKPTEIVYSRLSPNLQASPTGANSPTVWVCGQDGSNDRQITTGMQPRVSDDGKYLLFKRFPGSANNPFGNPWAGEGQLWTRELKTGTETMIFSWSGSQYVLGYSFSPFGNQAGYQIIVSFVTLTYKVNLDGTGGTPLSGQFERDYFPVARRGDSRIVSHAQDGTGLVTLTLDTATRTLIPNTLSNDYNPSWSNDNQFVGYGSINPANANPFSYNAPYPYVFSKIGKIKPDGTSKTTLLDVTSSGAPNGFTFGNVWSEDNSKIIVAAKINGVAGLFAVSTNGSGAFSQIPISAGNAPDWVGGIVSPRVEQNVTSAGGGQATNGNYSLVSTIGETVAGQTSVGGNYSFESGFWASFTASKKTKFDFDGDSKTDIGIFRPSTGAWWINASSTNVTTALGFGAASDKLVPGDYTGDGKSDVAFFRPSSGQWFILRSEDYSFYGFPFGASTDIPSPGDYDGDGKTDAAVFRPSNSGWYIQRSSDGGITSQAFGTSEDQPVVADYDGDGKDDIAIFRPSTSAWWILRSSNNSVLAVQFGQAGDKTVQGDYTGDGKADIAFYRPSNGFWFIVRSEDYSFYGFPFGGSEDLPSPGDYDGDGKTDAAVFRPSNAGWYLLRSTAGATSLQFGTSGDAPIPNSFVRSN